MSQVLNDYTGNLVVTQDGVSTSGEKSPASVYLVNNFVLNHSMERSEEWQFIKTGTVTDSEGYSGSHSYIGNKALRLGATETSSGGRLRYRQMFTNTDVVPGKTYTLSAYIKTTGFLTLTSGKYGAGLVVYCYYEDGTSINMLLLQD